MCLPCGTCVTLEYFMVEERVNSDQRQMWSHSLKADDKKLSGQDLRTRQRVKHFSGKHVFIKRGNEKKKEAEVKDT